MTYFRQLTQLKKVSIHGTDGNLAGLRNAKQLTHLFVRAPVISSVSSLTHMDGLAHLHLIGDVRDSLSGLGDVRSLYHIQIEATTVIPSSAVEEIRRAHPKARVYVSQRKSWF